MALIRADKFARSQVEGGGGFVVGAMCIGSVKNHSDWFYEDFGGR